ncbi:MAG: hypothetical protein R2873_36045 [Caldilineaceae bacterium]
MRTILVTLGTDMAHQDPQDIAGALSPSTRGGSRSRLCWATAMGQRRSGCGAADGKRVHDVTLLKGVEDMPGLMAQADLADQRRGSTTYELGSWAS